MLIKNATVNTVTGGVINNGWILCRGGKILAIGRNPDIPDVDDEVFDAGGMLLLPGFVDAHTHIGMWEDGLGFEGDDGNEDSDPSTPHLSAVDAVNPMEHCFDEALGAGVTTVVTGPGSANPIGGKLIAMKTYGCCVDDMLIDSSLAVKFALGENPKTTYHEKNQSPVTRMATAAIIREQLYKARRYMEDVAAAKAEGEAPPEYDIKCQALIPLLKGEEQAHFHAHRCDDIFTAIRIIKEFGLNGVLVHATEGYKIAERLAKENIPVLCGPVLCDRSKPELKSHTPSAAGILAKAGVTTAIISDHPVVPLQYLNLCAGLAVREGMNYDDALRAVTINPAKICNIDDRVGSIEIGKDGDFVLFDGDPLTLSAKPAAVFVNGTRVK